MTPTPSPDPGRCPECGCGWWEPHRTGCSEPRFLTPDPARYVSPVCRDGSHQACANFRGTCRCTCHAAAVEGTERPDTAALLTIGDWLLRTLPGHQGAEQTAAALAYTARWIDAQPPVPPTPASQPDDGLRAEISVLVLALWNACTDGWADGDSAMASYITAAQEALSEGAPDAATAPSAPVERPAPGQFEDPASGSLI